MKETNQIDELFRSALEGDEARPGDGMWASISDQLSAPHQVDALFAEALQHHEVSPPDGVWYRVRQRLPLNLYVRRYLGQLSRIAAVLLVGMMAVMLYYRLPESAPVAASPALMAPHAPVEVMLPDFTVIGVKEIQATVPVALSESTTDEEDDRIALAERLSAIFEGDDIEVDAAVIEEALKPLEQLSMDAAVAYLPEHEAAARNIDIEYSANVTWQFAEWDEIEQILQEGD